MHLCRFYTWLTQLYTRFCTFSGLIKRSDFIVDVCVSKQLIFFFQTTVFDKDEFEDEDATVSTSVAEDINSEEDAQVIKLNNKIV